MVHIDSFSGLVADLSKKDQGGPDKVLAALAISPWVSTFDMSESESLRASLRHLLDSGMIEERKALYPWLRFRITSKGKEDA